MATLNEIEAFLNETLQAKSFSDYCPNGIQVRGQERVNTVVTGVSASLALFREAVGKRADLVLTHHGLIWDRESRVVEGNFKRRLYFLLQHDLTLMAYHLPLDAHPELGNNARLMKALGLTPGAPFATYRGNHLSRLGSLPQPATLPEFAARVKNVLGGDPFILPFGPDFIERVAVCSGGAADLVREAKDLGAHLYLTGEVSEPVFHFAQEEGIHFMAAGHHRTETLGVQAAGELLAERFGITHHFINIPNPI